MHTERFYAASFADTLAIFIMPTDTGTHTGILFMNKGIRHIQDVQWHERFRSQVCQGKYDFVVPILEDEEVNDVSGVCRLIHGRQASNPKYKIPYAFHPANSFFEPTTGELVLGDGLGLSCSTFVLKVFEAGQVRLVDVDQWPTRPEDDARHEQLLADMERGFPDYGISGADAEHIAKVRATLPCIRVRPEEVAGCGLLDLIPTPKYPQVEPAGAWIRSKLTAA